MRILRSLHSKSIHFVLVLIISFIVFPGEANSDIYPHIPKRLIKTRNLLLRLSPYPDDHKWKHYDCFYFGRIKTEKNHLLSDFEGVKDIISMTDWALVTPRMVKTDHFIEVAFQLAINKRNQGRRFAIPSLLVYLMNLTWWDGSSLESALPLGLTIAVSSFTISWFSFMYSERGERDSKLLNVLRSNSSPAVYSFPTHSSVNGHPVLTAQILSRMLKDYSLRQKSVFCPKELTALQMN